MDIVARNEGNVMGNVMNSYNLSYLFELNLYRQQTHECLEIFHTCYLSPFAESAYLKPELPNFKLHGLGKDRHMTS